MTGAAPFRLVAFSGVASKQPPLDPVGSNLFSGVDQHRSRGPKVPTAPGRMEGPVVGGVLRGHNLAHGRPGAYWIREGDSLF